MTEFQMEERPPNVNSESRERVDRLFTEFAALVDAVTAQSGQRSGSRSLFSAAIEVFLDGLRWSQRDLAEQSGIAQSQISAFLRETGSRDIGQDDVCRVAWAIAGGIDASRTGERGDDGAQVRVPAKQLIGRGRVDILVNGLLVLAGYSPSTSYENAIWRQKFESAIGDTPGLRTLRPRLRVGWFEWSPVSEPGFSGVARDITDAVCHLLGHEDYEPVPIRYEDMKPMIRDRRIDLVAPLVVKLAHRLTWFRFSAGIPEMRVGTGVVLRTRDFERLLTDAGKDCVARGMRPDYSHLDLSKAQVHVAKDDFAAQLAPVLFGNNARLEKLGGGSERRDEVFERVLREDVSGDEVLVPLVFTTWNTCLRLTNTLADDVCLLNEQIDWLQLERLTLPLAFAVHPREPALSEAIDEAIAQLDNAKFFSGLKARHSDAFNALRCKTGSEKSFEESDASMNGLARHSGSRLPEPLTRSDDPKGIV